MTTKWSPATSTSSACRAGRGRRGDVLLRLADRDDRRRRRRARTRPVRRAGSCWRGSTSASAGSGRVAEERLHRSAAEPVAVGGDQVEDAGLRDHVGDRVDRGAGPGREVAAGRVAEGDDAWSGRGRGRRGSRSPRARRRGSAGTPPPLPDPAVLDVERGPAPLGQVGGERPPSDEVVGRLPEAAVDHHDHAARRAVGQRQLDELARVVAVPDRLDRLQVARLTRSSSPQPAQHGDAHRARAGRAGCAASPRCSSAPADCTTRPVAQLLRQSAWMIVQDLAPGPSGRWAPRRRRR